MELAYVTTYDPTNIHHWSGTGFYMYQTFKNSGIKIKSISNLKEHVRSLHRFKKTFYSKVRSKSYLWEREPSILKSYASQVEKHLKSIHCDIVFSPGTIPIALLNTNKPIIFWADATFAGMTNFYPKYTNLSNETIKHGNKMEQVALSRCQLAIYSSEWAANTAIQYYDVDPAKVKVVPFGANIENEKAEADIKGIIANKKFDVCKLLFIGVDWQRKGGDIALKVAELLNKKGIRTELHIIGCKPPSQTPEYVKLYGYISKTTIEGKARLERLFSESHFLILPAKAECYGIVLTEASSFGLPSIATNVGGIPTIIHNGKNGYVFPSDECQNNFCECIARIFSSSHEYKQLSISAFNEYSQRLNWNSSGKKVSDLMHTLK